MYITCNVRNVIWHRGLPSPAHSGAMFSGVPRSGAVLLVQLCRWTRSFSRSLFFMFTSTLGAGLGVSDVPSARFPVAHRLLIESWHGADCYFLPLVISRQRHVLLEVKVPAALVPLREFLQSPLHLAVQLFMIYSSEQTAAHLRAREMRKGPPSGVSLPHGLCVHVSHEDALHSGWRVYSERNRRFLYRNVRPGQFIFPLLELQGPVCTKQEQGIGSSHAPPHATSPALPEADSE